MLSCLFTLFVLLTFIGFSSDHFFLAFFIFVIDAAVSIVVRLESTFRLTQLTITVIRFLLTGGISICGGSITAIISWFVGYILYFSDFGEQLLIRAYDLPYGLLYNESPMSPTYRFIGILYLLCFIKNIVLFVRYNDINLKYLFIDFKGSITRFFKTFYAKINYKEIFKISSDDKYLTNPSSPFYDPDEAEENRKKRIVLFVLSIIVFIFVILFLFF